MGGERDRQRNQRKLYLRDTTIKPAGRGRRSLTTGGHIVALA